jgi:hypothetical protein
MRTSIETYSPTVQEALRMLAATSRRGFDQGNLHGGVTLARRFVR